MATKKTKKKNIKIKKTVKKSKQKIDKNMTFSEVLTKYPESAGIMMNYGLHCIGCQVAAFETIEQGAKAHGISSKDLNKMIDELNNAANEKKIEYLQRVKQGAFGILELKIDDS